MKKKLKLIPYKIYIFRKNKVLYAIGRVKSRKIIIFGQGFKLVKDKRKDKRLNTYSHIYKRARRSIIASVSNSLNAFQMFGEAVLTEDGNEVDWMKFQEEEIRQALTIAKKHKFKAYDKKIFKFDVIEIKSRVAVDNGLI